MFYQTTSKSASFLVALLCITASQPLSAKSVDPLCYSLFERENAIPGTPTCKLTAAGASGGMGSYYCTAGTTYITAYCGDNCYKPVVDLGKSPNPSNSPTSGFTSTQICIANKTCLNKENLNNQKWIDAVVPDFINPYIEKTGKWNETIQECKALPSGISKFWKGKYCEGQMAKYHIQIDHPFIGFIADQIAQRLRNTMRANCVAFHTKNNLPIESNEVSR